MKQIRIYLIPLCVLLISFAAATVLAYHSAAGGFLVSFFLLLALAFQRHPNSKGYSFTIIIMAAASLAMYFPDVFIEFHGVRLSSSIIPLMQLIMFGMGTALSLADFKRVVSMPKGVFAGLLCQYTIMPYAAYMITLIFHFPPEVAAGIILIGSCPGGLASNVISYLARANLALSITLTAISTMIAPIATPYFMKLLAGQLVEMDFWKMVGDISKIVLLPVAAGLLFNHFVKGKWQVLERFMPLLSMAGIVLIILVITAAGRSHLLVLGPKLLIAMVIHNLIGYYLGYYSARLFGLNEQDRRTISIEVGLQNAGLGSSIALAMGKLSTVGLASAVFAPVMNITGSAIGSWWRNRPLDEPEADLNKKHVQNNVSSDV